jgi:hypothetical protein
MNYESPTLYFLRQFPAWIPLLAVTLIFAALYYYTQDVTYREWTGLTLTSFFTALGMQRTGNTASSANTTTGDVNVIAPAENLNNLTDAEINKAVEKIEE